MIARSFAPHEQEVAFEENNELGGLGPGLKKVKRRIVEALVMVLVIVAVPGLDHPSIPDLGTARLRITLPLDKNRPGSNFKMSQLFADWA